MYSNGYSGYTYGDRGKVGERSNIYGGSTAIKPTSMISSTGSSNIRASSQLKPIKPTNYGLQPEPTSISIFRTPGIGGSSIRSTYMPTVNDPGRPKGLANLRNTCYINSVLQILFDLMNLPVNAFSKAVTKSYCNLKDSHGYAEYKQFKREVQKKMPFVVGDDQQDAQEFLRGLLEILNQENKEESVNKKPRLFQYNTKLSTKENWMTFCKEMRYHDNSHVIDVFGGETFIELKCTNGHSKFTFERYMDLTLSFPKDRQQNDLKTFLRNYFKQEQVEGVECEECKKKTKFNRKVLLYSLPNVLVLHLNRFQQGYYSNMKIRSGINYDDTITLPPDILHPDARNSPKFKLVGIICHLGSMNSGHYYAIKRGKGARSADWYVCNDEIVKEADIRANGNESESAYIFFYARVAS